AVYNADGVLKDVEVLPVAAIDMTQIVDTELAVTSGDICKAMLVESETYAPLCEAWYNTKE
ncbi:MAG: hypothetical protein J5449_13230, partial [Oscillospiraceae bacterium]|nr:hypothetical protein [Oscillospiraceae bacterium]